MQLAHLLFLLVIGFLAWVGWRNGPEFHRVGIGIIEPGMQGLKISREFRN
jgi:hypothetical protein